MLNLSGHKIPTFRGIVEYGTLIFFPLYVKRIKRIGLESIVGWVLRCICFCSSGESYRKAREMNEIWGMALAKHLQIMWE